MQFNKYTHTHTHTHTHTDCVVMCNLINTHTHTHTHTYTHIHQVHVTRAGTRVSTGAGTGARIERRVVARKSLGTYDVVLKVGRKTRKERRRQRVNSSFNRKTRRPNKTVASRRAKRNISRRPETCGVNCTYQEKLFLKGMGLEIPVFVYS